MNDRILDFFNDHILPLNNHATEAGLQYLDMEIDKARESYFSEPLHPEYLYLNNIPFETRQIFEDYLRQFWKDQPEFQKLIPDLARLAFELKEENREQSAELSPFIYAMF